MAIVLYDKERLNTNNINKFSATQPWVDQFVNSKLSLGVSYVKPKDLVGSYKVCRVLKRL